MRISVAFATIFSALSVVALPLALRDSSDPSLSLRTDDTFSAEAIFYIRALTPAQKAAKVAAKAARATTHKTAGLATQKTKTKVQVQGDRKARKELQVTNKAAKAAKAQAKPTYKSHEQKIKDKATVVFSPGASRRLDGMGLHGKARKSAKKYHKNIMLAEMKKKGATKGIVVATAHQGGIVKSEKNHITAQFFKGHKKGSSNGGAIPSSWTDKATGKVKVGEKDQHHVYVNDKQKVPSAWSKALDASRARKTAAEEKEKAKSGNLRDAKVADARVAGTKKAGEISPEDKKAQRKAVKEEKAARKKKPT